MSWEPTERDLRLHFLELEGVLDRVERSTSHYELLGVERSATSEQISQAQRRTMAVLNPSDSRHGSLSAVVSRRISATIKQAVKAYMVLANYGSRIEYDNSLIRRAPVPLPIDLGIAVSKRPAPRPVAEAKFGHNKPIESIAAPHIATAKTNPDPYVGGLWLGAAPPSSTGADSDTIAINHSSAQVLYTKSPDECKKGADKRRYQRLRLAIPTYVTGYDRTQGKWTEVAHTLDVSIGGISLQLAKEMPEGAVVHLTIPMPTKLRRHGYSDPTYQVYAIVRRVQLQHEKRRVVGLEFLGASPPPGYLKKPWAKFQTKW